MATASGTAAPRGFDEIHVGPICHTQTPANRFGPHVLEDLKAFVFEGHHFQMDFDDDDDEDEDEDDGDDDDGDIDDGGTDMLEDFWPEYSAALNAFAPATFPLPPAVNHDGAQDTQQNPQHTFPRVARARSNLTALSQRFNLYFAAYQDKIHVFQPKKAPQILPPPSLVLSPRKTKAGKTLGGVIDRVFGHQINNIMVGNLGNFEVVFFAYDDGDVGAYYTHTVARCIKINGTQNHGVGGTPPRPTMPKEFFHDNVGLSAWGLAIHERSRLLAVSSNRHEVTVFAFSTSLSPVQLNSTQEEDTSPKVWSGQTALELEKHFQSRTRTWRIVLPTGPEGHNIPSIAFCDDETGYADKIVAFDITGNTWILDIWKVGSFPILYPANPARAGPVHPRYTGWCVLVLPDSSFKQTGTFEESVGLPGAEIISCSYPPAVPVTENWLDTTCSLYYVRDLAPDPDILLQQRHSSLYRKVHANSHRRETSPGKDTAPVHPTYATDDNSDMFDSGSDVEYPTGISPIDADNSVHHRWSALASGPGPAGATIDDLSDEVHLGRAIVPSLGLTQQLDGSHSALISFAGGSTSRQHKTKSIKFAKAEFAPHMAKNLTILRTSATDIELQPFDQQGTGIICKSVLTSHDHQGRRATPYDLTRPLSERVTMVLHVPELNLVVAGSLNGRVALLTLTKTNKRVAGVPLRRGFRVDWVLPRRAEEEKRVRPWCALHGIAISPVPDAKASGLDLDGRRPRVPPLQYRLILHYMDHTILMYRIMRRSGGEDLLIF